MRKTIKRDPPCEMTDDLRRRFEELSQPTIDEMKCDLCGGIGLPKRTSPLGRLVCLPCVWTLQHHDRPDDRMKWQLLRLPYFRDYLTHPERSTLAA